ncbi:MAG: type VI secretion system protein TssA [Desulfatirhabdiaceae bacterium]
MNFENLGRSPIPGPSPAGQDIRYDPEYSRLQEEIDKLNSVTLAGSVDWNRVVNLGAEILETRSKDILVAVYMSVGLMQTLGIEGMIAGVGVINDLVTTFWDDGFPSKKRLRGRINAFSWWQEKTQAWIRNYSGDTGVPNDRYQALVSGLTSLDQFLGDAIPDFPPMRELLNAIQRLPVDSPPAPVSETPPETAEARPVQPTADSPVEKTVSQHPQQPATGTPEDTHAARSVLADAALTFATMAQTEDSRDPWVWRASRIAAWIRVKNLPPAQGKQTMIPPPEADIKSAVSTLISNGRHLDAARAAESRITASIFWLDLHRLIATALERLGRDYAGVLEAVTTEVRLLLRQFPGIEELEFSDGTPFADAETRSWLAALMHGPSEDAKPSAPVSDELATRALDEADQRFADKDLSGALDAISTAMRRMPDGHSRFRLRLAQINMLIQSGRFSVAAAMAEEVLTAIDRHTLADWDPDLALTALMEAHKAHAGMSPEKGDSRLREIAARIGILSPSAALNLPGF